jgi:hypothetical protein
MVLHPDFRDLLSALADSSAEYLVIGGWAVGVHAEPRFTRDLDIFIGTDDQNLLRVVHAFERFGAPAHILEGLRTLRPDEFLFLGVAPARVDVLRTIPGVAFEAAYPRKLRVEWDGLVADVIGRDDLLIAKRAAGRAKDLRDVRALERAAKRAPAGG